MWALKLRPGADCDWRWVVCPPPAAKMLDRYDCCVPEVHIGKLYWRENPAGLTEHIVEILTSSSRAVWPSELCYIAGYDLVEGFQWQQYVYSPGAFASFQDPAGWSSEVVLGWKPAADWIMQMQGDVDDINGVYSFADHMAAGELHAARQHGQHRFCQRLKQHNEGAITELQESKLKLDAELHRAQYQLREARKLAMV
ncbi:g6936 [Coccomyxa elongata]